MPTWVCTLRSLKCPKKDSSNQRSIFRSLMAFRDENICGDPPSVQSRYVALNSRLRMEEHLENDTLTKKYPQISNSSTAFE